MYSEQQIVDLIEVSLDNSVRIRFCKKVLKNNEEISVTYHRQSLLPGQDVSQFDDRVKNVCNSLWTSDVINEFQASSEKLGVK